MKVVLFSAHPDDEVLGAGGLITRLKREDTIEIINYSLTYGNPSQVDVRRNEVSAACKLLEIESKNAGLSLVEKTEIVSGKDEQKLRIPKDDTSIGIVLGIIQNEKPDIIITHHNNDAHPDHIAANYLVNSALKVYHPEVLVLFHRIWKDLSSPNLLVEISNEDLERKANAMRYHESEVTRNIGLLDVFVYAHASTAPLLYCERILGWGCPNQGIKFAEPFEAVYNSDRRFSPRVISLKDKVNIVS